MANFWDDYNAKAAQFAQQGGILDWDSFSRLEKIKNAGSAENKKGFWQDQISTGGGIAGALAGGAAGTAIMPGVGTLLGAILGGALGSGGGELAENAITGEEDLLKNVGKEAVLGGVFAAPPLRAAKGLAGLARGGGKEVVEQALTGPGVLSSITSKLGNTGRNLQRDVTGVGKVADTFTQESQILDTINRRNLRGSGNKLYQNVDTELGNISGEVDNILSSIKTTAPRQGTLNSLRKNAADMLPADSAYTKELTRSLERLSKVGVGNVGPQELFAFKKELSGRLGNAFKKLDRGSPLTPKEEVDMALWRNLDNEITKLAPQVKNLTLDQSNLITARPGFKASSEKSIGIPLLGVKSRAAAGKIQAGQDLISRGLQRVAGSPTAQKANPMAPGGIVAREVLGGAAVSPLLDEQASVDSQSLDGALLTGGAGMIPPTLDPTDNPFGVSQDQIAAQMMVALQRGDKEGFSQLKTMYDLIGDSMGGAGGKPTTVEGQKAYNNAMAGLGAIDDLESMLGQDSSLTWKSALPGGALTDSLLGASQYETALRNAMDAMARLRTGAALTASEEKNFREMLPKAGDTPETIAYKINTFRTYFNEVLNQPAATSPSSLEEALTGL